MLDVFFTVDVEIWCDGWQHLDDRFPGAFRQYIYGPTPGGAYGLPFQIDVLNSHGLTGVFFVEPLFATRFGSDPLTEILGLLSEGNQEIQLHLHSEWVDESRTPLLANVHQKRQHLRYFSLPEQATLIDLGKRLIQQNGGGDVNAFRAGSFGFNRDTLVALRQNGIRFDSSYNAICFGRDSGVMPGETVVEPIECEGVIEYPMTVFSTANGVLRHAQLTACSFQELESLLWMSLEAGRSSVVILSHNFEFLNEAKNRADEVVVKRFRNLCAFLDRNRDSFRVRGFRDLEPRLSQQQPEPIAVPGWRTAVRLLEQVYRRRYR